MLTIKLQKEKKAEKNDKTEQTKEKENNQACLSEKQPSHEEQVNCNVLRPIENVTFSEPTYDLAQNFSSNTDQCYSFNFDNPFENNTSNITELANLVTSSDRMTNLDLVDDNTCYDSPMMI